MTDLIIVVEYNKNTLLEETIKSLDKHKFNKKYIIFDHTIDSLNKRMFDKFIKYKKSIKEYYPDYQIIENVDYLKYKGSLKSFISKEYNQLSENLYVIKSNVIIQGSSVEDFDLDKVLQVKSVFDECLILYFREHILRLNHWFSGIDYSQELIKTHAFCENCFLTTKEYLNKILNCEAGDGEQIINYYTNSLKNKSTEEQLEVWKRFGIYEHKTIRHKINK